MLSNLRAYQLAVQFHRSCQSLALPDYLRDQMLRASASIVLNLAEGSAKPTARDQARFYFTALGSLRECQAALAIAPRAPSELAQLADTLGGHVYRLAVSAQRRGGSERVSRA